MERTKGHERRTVIYAGTVQGVGFRMTAVQIARGFAVVGYVRNLEDGRVELVVEGAPRELDQFLAAVADKLESHIRHVQTSVQTGNGEFIAFEIQY